MVRTLLTTALLLAMAAPALADDDDNYEDRPFDRPRTELGFGMYVGGFEVGPVGGPAIGVHLDIGHRRGPLMIHGEYALLSIGESSYDNPDPISGQLHRFGINARYNFADFGGGRYTPIRGAFWLEGGVGHQTVLWEEGGKLSRPDIALGFGAELDIRSKRRGNKKPKYWSIYYAFRMTIADAPGTKQMEPTCAGPCDEPTLPSPYDIGFFFNMGFTFGR